MIYSRNARVAYKISLNRLVASPSADGVDSKATPEPTEHSHHGRRDDPCFDLMFFIIISLAPSILWDGARARGMRCCGNGKFDDSSASALDCFSSLISIPFSCRIDRLFACIAATLRDTKLHRAYIHICEHNHLLILDDANIMA